MVSNKLASIGVGIVALGLTLSMAGPASAAQSRTLPAGETLFAIDCQTDIGQLASIDVASAVGTAIGTGTSDSHVSCAADSTYDVTTGKVFWAAWAENNELFSMDPSTGVSTYIGTLDTAVSTIDVVSALMSGTDGVIYALYSRGSDNAQQLGTVDTTTGTITFLHDVRNGGDLLLDGNLWSAEYNPADSKFYVINSEELFSIDVTTGLLTSKGLKEGVDVWYGLTFDSNGVMWSTGRDSVASSTVDGWSTPGNQEDSDSDTTLDSASWYSESNFIILASVPAPPVEPALANTGVNSTQVGYLAAGGAVVALLGAGIILAGRRHKVSN